MALTLIPHRIPNEVTVKTTNLTINALQCCMLNLNPYDSFFKGFRLIFKIYKNKKAVCLLFCFGFSEITEAEAGFLLFTEEDHSLGHIRDVYASCQRISCKF